MNDTVHVFFDNTFVMGLHDLTNDITTVKFVVAKFNKQILYRDFVSNTLKNHVCESYNVLVDLPKVKKLHFNPAKTSHYKLDWNKLSVVLNRFSSENTIKMLELNTDNKIMFVVERMKANLLLSMFEPISSIFVFSAGINEVDLIKLKLLSGSELNGITKGNKKLYNERIESILSCKVYNFMMHLMLVVFQNPDNLNIHISFILHV